MKKECVTLALLGCVFTLTVACATTSASARIETVERFLTEYEEEVREFVSVIEAYREDPEANEEAYVAGLRRMESFVHDWETMTTSMKECDLTVEDCETYKTLFASITDKLVNALPPDETLLGKESEETPLDTGEKVDEEPEED